MARLLGDGNELDCDYGTGQGMIQTLHPDRTTDKQFITEQFHYIQHDQPMLTHTHTFSEGSRGERQMVGSVCGEKSLW